MHGAAIRIARRILRRTFGRTEDRDGTRRTETSDELNYLIRI